MTIDMTRDPNRIDDSEDEDIVTHISLDVAMGVSPAKSRRVKYGPAELAAYDRMKAEFAAARKENPSVVWEHPD